MLRWQKWVIVWSGIIVAIIIWEFLAFSICKEEYAKQQQYAATPYQKPQSEICILHGPIAAVLRLRRFVSAHSEGISAGVTAAATVFIALFTLTLWRTSEKHSGHLETSVKLAQRAAEDASAIEMAKIFLIHTELPLVNANDGSNKIYGRANIIIKNLGRTPAIVSRAAFDLTICKFLPDKPEYDSLRDFMYGETIIEPNEQWNERAHFIERILTTDDWQRIIRSELTIWLYGIIIYWDIFHCENSYAFCARWFPQRVIEVGTEEAYAGRFIQWNEPKYSYHFRNPDPGDATRPAPILTAIPRKTT